MTSKVENDFCLKKDINYTHHWNEAYRKTTTEKLGGFEKEATPTLQLIFVNPNWDDKPYVYTLLKKVKKNEGYSYSLL